MMTMIDGWLVAVIFENDVCDVCGVRPRNHTTVCSHSCVTQHIVSSGDVRVVWSLFWLCRWLFTCVDASK